MEPISCPTQAGVVGVLLRAMLVLSPTDRTAAAV